jgi:hypothetical protein
MKRGPCEQHAINGPCPNCGLTTNPRASSVASRVATSPIGMSELQRAAQAVCNEQTNPSPQYRFVPPGYGIAVEVLIAAGVLNRADIAVRSVAKEEHDTP